MRELTYIGDRRVEWRKRPDPGLESRFDAIVKPVAATTCDVDKMIVAGKAPVPEGTCESAGNHFKPGELPLFVHTKPVFVREPVNAEGRDGA